MTYSQAKAAIRKAGFRTKMWRVWDDSEPGTYLGSDPEGKAHSGEAVALKVSKGPEPAPEPTYTQPEPPRRQPDNPRTSEPGNQQNPPSEHNRSGGNTEGNNGQRQGRGNGGGQQNPPATTRHR